jgi:hypothetical protein
MKAVPRLLNGSSLEIDYRCSPIKACAKIAAFEILDGDGDQDMLQAGSIFGHGSGSLASTKTLVRRLAQIGNSKQEIMSIR